MKEKQGQTKKKDERTKKGDDKERENLGRWTRRQERK